MDRIILVFLFLLLATGAVYQFVQEWNRMVEHHNEIREMLRLKHEAERQAFEKEKQAVLREIEKIRREIGE